MKNILRLFLASILLLTMNQCSKTDPKKPEVSFGKEQLTENINRLFIAVDDRNWEQVSELLNDTVLLDYTSMAGGSPALLSSQQIIESWKSILPGFDKTHHQLGNLVIDEESAPTYKVFCYGTATHYLKNETNNNVWTVVGSYNFELEAVNMKLKITKMKFNLKYLDGNNNLAMLAQEKIKNNR